MSPTSDVSQTKKKQFLLDWMMARPLKRFTPEQLIEQVKADYKRLHGESFKDVARAARDLAARRRVERTTRGKDQRYWYDPDTDSGKPLIGPAKTPSASEAAWNKYLRGKAGVNRRNWEALRSRIESDLSPAQARTLLSQVSKLLAKSRLTPPT